MGSHVPVAGPVADPARHHRRRDRAADRLERGAASRHRHRPAVRGGDYYYAEPGDGPWHGLAVARQISQITYRTGESFEDRFGRDHNDPIREFDQWGRFEIESYLDHHGQKLVRRFDANSFLILSKAMDLHDLGRGRGGTAATWVGSRCPSSPPPSRPTRSTCPRSSARSTTRSPPPAGAAGTTSSRAPQGHDGFLLEHEALGPLITEAIEEAEKSDE